MYMSIIISQRWHRFHFESSSEPSDSVVGAVILVAISCQVTNNRCTITYLFRMITKTCLVNSRHSAERKGYLTMVESYIYA